jgi:peptide/nickel transport system permease protein
MSFWGRFFQNRSALIGGALIIILFGSSILAPLLSPYKPDEVNLQEVLSPPSRQHPLGTDELGRDVLSRILWGGRVSLLVGFVAVGISTLVGIFFGALAGYYGRWVDSLIMRFVDIMLCFPTFFLILAVIAFLEATLWNIMAIIGLTSWMGVTRLVRAEFLSLKERDFVLAARSIGASSFRIIFHHILPNALGPVFVSAILGMGNAILVESALSFLGIGIQPPSASWGNMLTSGKDYLEVAWWLSLFPGLAILITVLGFNLLGEGLKDALNPRLNDKSV